MDVENSSERTWGDDSMLSALNNPENFGFTASNGSFLQRGSDVGRTPGRRRVALPITDSMRDNAFIRSDGLDLDGFDSARSDGSNISTGSALSSPRSNSSLSTMMRDALTLDSSSANPNDADGERGNRKDDSNKLKAKKKRVRRTATEIERNWKCELCGKSYGSEGALKTHLKLKHPGVKIPKKEDMYGGNGPARYLAPQTLAMPFGTPSFMPSLKPDDPASRRAQSLPAYKRGLSGVGTAKAGSTALAAASTSDALIKTEDASSASGSLPSSPVFTPVTSPGANGPDDDRMSTVPGTVYVPALMYQCGSYQRQSSFCGDLVLAVNLTERKLAWDVFAVNSLLRMEISFDDIATMGIEPQNDTNCIVLLNLSKPPTFFCGWSEPHTPTVWVRVNDFTGNQAVRFRHHVFCFLNTALSEPLNRLFEQEPRLKKLADLGVSPDEPLHYSDAVIHAAMSPVQPTPVPRSPMSPASPISPDGAYATPEMPRPTAPAPNMPRPTGNRVSLSQLNKAQRKQLLRPHGVAPQPPPAQLQSGYQQHYAPPPMPASHYSSMDDDDSAMDTSMGDPSYFAAPARSHSMPMRTDFLGNVHPQVPPAFGGNVTSTTAFGFSSGSDMMGTFSSASFAEPSPAPTQWPNHSDFMDGIDESISYQI